MTFVNRPLSGASFFTNIRSQMNSDRGMFKGRDGELRYVVMDASFYQLEIFIRPDSMTFTDAAVDKQGREPAIRVVATGQYVNNYCHTGPCHIDWQGQIIVRHNTRRGVPPSFPDYRYIGQWDGRTERSVVIGLGDPDGVPPPTPPPPAHLNHAMGRLLPVLISTRSATATQLGTWWSEPPRIGKAIYGIHRSSQSLIVIVQQHFYTRNSSALDIQELIARLTNMGVDDVVMGDGSTSAILVADGNIEVQPPMGAGYKNYSLATGIMFRLQTLTTDPPTSSSTLDGIRTTDTDFLSNDPHINPVFHSTRELSRANATVELTDSGSRITIYSFGGISPPSGGDPEEAADYLGVSVPLELTASTSELTARPVTFNAPAAPITADLQLIVTNPNDDGRLRGNITIDTLLGVLVMNVDWVLVD